MAGRAEMSETPVPEAMRLRVEDIIEAIPDIIYTLDLELRLVRWNRRMETVTGYSREELLGRNALDFFVEADRPHMAGAIRRAFETDYAEVEGHFLRKDGNSIPYHWTGVPLRDAQGCVIGLAGAGRNIAERKQAEDALATERERLAVTLRSIRDAVLATDGRGCVVRINEVAEAWCGVPCAGAIGKPARDDLCEGGWFRCGGGTAALSRRAAARPDHIRTEAPSLRSSNEPDHGGAGSGWLGRARAGCNG